MNVIKYQSAEAVTVDGVNWDSYVGNEELLKDLDDCRRVQISDIRYGKWSKQSGHKRGPLYPSEEFRIMEHMGAIVYEYLVKNHETVPFPFSDHYELWLLDMEQQPLALINSAVRKKDVDLDTFIDWRAGNACREHFHSLTLEQNNITTSAADYLTDHILQLIGGQSAAQWFHRDGDGCGHGLSGINISGLENHRLSSHAFPEFFIREDPSDNIKQELINEFISWQAAWILLLDSLDHATRQHFEVKARQQALNVADQYKLYPDIIDQGSINSARVEVRMRNSFPSEEPQDKTMSTFYIELNPGPTD